MGKRYYCAKCKTHHISSSNIGKGHARFRAGKRKSNPPTKCVRCGKPLGHNFGVDLCRWCLSGRVGKVIRKNPVYDDRAGPGPKRHVKPYTPKQIEYDVPRVFGHPEETQPQPSFGIGPESKFRPRRQARLSDVSIANPTQTGFFVGNVLVSFDVFNSLPKTNQEEILRLQKEYNDIGVISPMFEIGPNQHARMSSKQRDKIGDNLLKGYAIEDKVKQLLKSDQTIVDEELEKKRKYARDRISQLERHISSLKSVGVGKGGKIRPSYQKEIDKTEQEIMTYKGMLNNPKECVLWDEKQKMYVCPTCYTKLGCCDCRTNPKKHYGTTTWSIKKSDEHMDEIEREINNGNQDRVMRLLNDSAGHISIKSDSAVWKRYKKLRLAAGYMRPGNSWKFGENPTPALYERRYEAIKEFYNLANGLSPENLTCDGECSATQVKQRRAFIMKQWKALEKKHGMKISLSEVENQMIAEWRNLPKTVLIKRNPPEEISRWSFTQATREVGCSKCGAKPGEHCKMPSGRDTREPHGERTKAYVDKIGKVEFDRRHSVPEERLPF